MRYQRYLWHRHWKNICITSFIIKIDIHNYCFLSHPLRLKSSEAKSRNPEYTAKRRLQCTHFKVHSSKCRLGQSETSKIEGNSWSLIYKWCRFGIKWYHIWNWNFQWYHFKIKWYFIKTLSDVALKLSDITFEKSFIGIKWYHLGLESNDITFRL